METVRGLASLRKRYKSLHVPSDFCQLHALWPNAQPLDLAHPVRLHFSQVRPCSAPAHIWMRNQLHMLIELCSLSSSELILSIMLRPAG